MDISAIHIIYYYYYFLFSDCDLCTAPKSSRGWQGHIHKVTLIRGTVSNITQYGTRHHSIHLTKVNHLNHDKRQSPVDSPELVVTVPSHCGCEQLELDKAYIIMSDEYTTWDEDFDSLTLRTTDFLARARNKLGRKIKHYLCKHNI